jgi:putative acetyltransferase
MDAPRPISIRDEQPGDAAAIHRVVAAAFKGRTEADLVDKLRANDRFALSLVAVQGGAVLGHVLLTDVTVAGNGLVPRGAGLAPLAVRPTFQRRGIGAMLVRAALKRSVRAGYGFVCLLGDPAYYQRFGFRSASTLGLASEFDAPPEAFLAIELAPGALGGVSGTVRYFPEFAEITA